MLMSVWVVVISGQKVDREERGKFHWSIIILRTLAFNT